MRKIRGGVLLHREFLLQLVETQVEIKITEYNAHFKVKTMSRHVIVRLSVEKSRIKSIDFKNYCCNVLTLQDMTLFYEVLSVNDPGSVDIVIIEELLRFRGE